MRRLLAVVLALTSLAACARGKGSLKDASGRDPSADALAATPLATAISLGQDNNFVALRGGALKGWGQNLHGGLGVGTQASYDLTEPLPTVFLPSDVHLTSVAIGLSHTCALFDNAKAKCWGEDAASENGDRKTQDSGAQARSVVSALPFLDLGANADVVSISAADGYSCALLGGGTVKCWGIGNGASLQMGDALTPLALPAGLGALSLYGPSGAIGPTCAILTDRSVACWTDAAGGGLTSVPLGTGLSAVNVAVGRRHVCALLTNGTVKCWGENARGQLGQGDTLARPALDAATLGDALPPVDLGTAVAVAEVVAGDDVSCVLTLDSRAKCWGSQEHGQLATGTSADAGDQPGTMGAALPYLDLGVADDGIVQLALSGGDACAVFASGRIKCWGEHGYGGAIVDAGRRPALPLPYLTFK